MSDVAKIASGGKAMYVIKPQEYLKVTVLNQDNIYIDDNDEEEKESIFYASKDTFKNALTGSGGDEYFKFSNAFVKWLEKTLAKAIKKKKKDSSGTQRCQGKNKTGSQCKMKATKGSAYCHHHRDQKGDNHATDDPTENPAMDLIKKSKNHSRFYNFLKTYKQRSALQPPLSQADTIFVPSNEAMKRAEVTEEGVYLWTSHVEYHALPEPGTFVHPTSGGTVVFIEYVRGHEENPEDYILFNDIVGKEDPRVYEYDKPWPDVELRSLVPRDSSTENTKKVLKSILVKKNVIEWMGNGAEFDPEILRIIMHTMVVDNTDDYLTFDQHYFLAAQISTMNKEKLKEWYNCGTQKTDIRKCIRDMKEHIEGKLKNK
jgi:hypothetical protein